MAKAILARRIVMHDIWLLGMGYLGLPLAHALHQHGQSVLASSRQAQTGDLPFSYCVFDIDGAVDEDDGLDFAQAKTWLCLLPPSCSAAYESFLSHYEKAAVKLGVNHIVYASSISVYGDETRDCFAHSPVDPKTPSAKIMVQVEERLLMSAIPNISVVRLAGLFSDDRHPILRLSAKGQVNGAGQCVNMIDKEAAVAALLACCMNPKGHVIVNAVMDEHPSKQVFYTQAAKKLLLPMPEFIHDTNSLGKCVYAGVHVITSES